MVMHPPPPSLSTERLLLRRWRPQDCEPFAALNSCVEVMEFFPKLLSREESDAMAGRADALFEEIGCGLWAVEYEKQMIGFIGIARPRFEAHFTPCLEVGWRLARPYWGKGLAAEGASAALDDVFERLNEKEIVSLTACVNQKSIRVMQKLGMTYNSADDFDHPLLPEGHVLRRHVLYRLKREDWHS